MALQTFAPSQNPNIGMDYQQQPRVLSAAFGDGYIQRTPDGINTKPRSYKFEWGPVAPEVADYIVNFLDGLGGVTPFWWTPPRESIPRRFICGAWQRAAVQWNADRVSAEFTEDFGLAA